MVEGWPWLNQAALARRPPRKWWPTTARPLGLDWLIKQGKYQGNTRFAQVASAFEQKLIHIRPENSYCAWLIHAVSSLSGNEVIATKQGFAVMKTRTTQRKTATRTARPRRNAKAEPKTEEAAAPVVRRTYNRRKAIEAPPILYEGDQPAPPPASGRKKYALGPVRPCNSLKWRRPNCPKPTARRNFF